MIHGRERKDGGEQQAGDSQEDRAMRGVRRAGSATGKSHDQEVVSQSLFPKLLKSRTEFGNLMVTTTRDPNS